MIRVLIDEDEVALDGEALRPRLGELRLGIIDDREHPKGRSICLDAVQIVQAAAAEAVDDRQRQVGLRMMSRQRIDVAAQVMLVDVVLGDAVLAQIRQRVARAPMVLGIPPIAIGPAWSCDFTEVEEGQRRRWR